MSEFCLELLNLLQGVKASVTSPPKALDDPVEIYSYALSFTDPLKLFSFNR